MAENEVTYPSKLLLVVQRVLATLGRLLGVVSEEGATWKTETSKVIERSVHAISIASQVHCFSCIFVYCYSHQYSPVKQSLCALITVMLRLRLSKLSAVSTRVLHANVNVLSMLSFQENFSNRKIYGKHCDVCRGLIRDYFNLLERIVFDNVDGKMKFPVNVNLNLFKTKLLMKPLPFFKSSFTNSWTNMES